MICIAAFVILLIIVLCLPIIRIFSRTTADKIWDLFKKSTYCVSRRVTLRKCDSSFKDDIKNSILRKVVLKHPTWVKPVSRIIEIVSVVIIIIAIWSLLVAVKAGVSLFVYGTCNATQPSACVLDSTSACSIDSTPVSFWQHPLKWTGNWFAEFGEAFAAIPARLKHWDATEYLPAQPATNSRNDYYNKYDPKKPVALDIFDPGCIICNRSFNEQLSSGFLDKYNVALMPYPINTDGKYKFANSFVIASYLEATRQVPLPNATHPAMWLIVKRLFTEKAPNGDGWQNEFNTNMTDAQARATLNKWLADFGYTPASITQIENLARSSDIAKTISAHEDLVNNTIKTKKIPTMIYDGQRHEGQFTAE